MVWRRARGEPVDPLIVILCAGLVTEMILPWIVIWLSDIFVFDIPIWSEWLAFGLPPVLSLLAVLILWVKRTWSGAVPVRVAGRHER
jgi:hypothetical protein